MQRKIIGHEINCRWKSTANSKNDRSVVEFRSQSEALRWHKERALGDRKVTTCWHRSRNSPTQATVDNRKHPLKYLIYLLFAVDLKKMISHQLKRPQPLKNHKLSKRSFGIVSISRERFHRFLFLPKYVTRRHDVPWEHEEDHLFGPIPYRFRK